MICHIKYNTIVTLFRPFGKICTLVVVLRLYKQKVMGSYPVPLSFAVSTSTSQFADYSPGSDGLGSGFLFSVGLCWVFFIVALEARMPLLFIGFLVDLDICVKWKYVFLFQLVSDGFRPEIWAKIQVKQRRGLYPSSSPAAWSLCLVLFFSFFFSFLDSVLLKFCITPPFSFFSWQFSCIVPRHANIMYKDQREIMSYNANYGHRSPF